MAVKQSGPQRMFQGKVVLAPGQLETVYRALLTFNGTREGGGLRDFLRCFSSAMEETLSVPESVPGGAKLFAAYVRVLLLLGAQQGFDLFQKACEKSRSDASLRKTVETLKAKTKKSLDELDAKDGETAQKSAEVGAFERYNLAGILTDCNDAIRCLDLFEPYGWYPFAELKTKYSAVSNFWFRQLVSQAIAHFSSYIELRKLAEVAHIERMIELQAWTAKSDDHRRYAKLQLRSKFVSAERQGLIRGHKGRLIGRHLAVKYLAWLRLNTDLVSWRSASDFVDLDDDAKAKVLAARPHRKASVEIAELFRLNPELAALDALHGEFDERFAQRISGKLLDDEYKQLPTYTEPELVFHHRGIVFSGEQTTPSGRRGLKIRQPRKRSLKGAKGRRPLPEVELLFPGVEASGSEWVKFNFIPDKRFRRFRVVSMKKGLSALYRDPHKKTLREAVFQGCRLRMESPKFDSTGEIESADVYLDFVVNLKPIPQNSRAKAVSWKKPSKGAKPQLSSLQIPAGTRVGLVVYDEQEVAWVTAGTWDGERLGQPHFRTRHICPLGQLKNEIQQQVALLARKRDQSGGLQRGQRFAREAHKRLQDLRESLRRQGAADIVHYLLGEDVLLKRQNGKTRHTRRNIGKKVDVVIIASPLYAKVFGGLGKRDNRSRAAFAAMSLHEQVVRSLMERGVKVLEVERFGYQHLCSKCGGLAVRYYFRKPKSEGPKFGKTELAFAKSGNLLACPVCGAHGVNASYNATRTLLTACVNPNSLTPYREFADRGAAEQETCAQKAQTIVRPKILEGAQLT